jgi:hypothetical protein
MKTPCMELYRKIDVLLLFCHLKYVTSESYNYDNDIIFLVAPNLLAFVNFENSREFIYGDGE